MKVSLIKASPLPHSNLPLVQAVRISVRLLTAARNVTLNRARRRLETCPSNYLTLNINFCVRVMKFIRRRVSINVRDVTVLRVSRAIRGLDASERGLRINVARGSRQLRSDLDHVFVVRRVGFS